MTKKYKKTKSSLLPPISPLNDKQKKLISAITLNDMIVAEGSAGTGKTFIVASMAADMLKSNAYKRIIFTRPVVPCGRSVGFIPGTLEEKMAPWIAPFIAVIKQRIPEGELEMFLKNGRIQSIPFETMRGSSFDDSIIILDEAQNSFPHEMKMFLTRIGEYSKTFVLGDISQSDLRTDRENGLEMVIRMIDEQGMKIPVVRFTSEDVVRSGLCKDWLKAFEKDKELPRFITHPNPV